MTKEEIKYTVWALFAIFLMVCGESIVELIN